MKLNVILDDSSDPLAGQEDVEMAVQPPSDEKLEYESPGGRYKLVTHHLTPTNFGHVVWDYMAEGNGHMQPFLAREDAILFSHGTSSYESAMRWHEKAIRFLYGKDK